MSGLKNPHYYVAVFIYYFGCKTRIILIYPPKLKCVWAKLFFSPACMITAYNNSTQHARSSSDEPNQSAFERD